MKSSDEELKFTLLILPNQYKVLFLLSDISDFETEIQEGTVGDLPLPTPVLWLGVVLAMGTVCYKETGHILGPVVTHLWLWQNIHLCWVFSSVCISNGSLAKIIGLKAL